MSLPAKLSAFVRSLLFGTPFGQVYPVRAAPAQATLDGRTVALEILKLYLSEIVFFRQGGVGPKGEELAPIPFRVEKDAIHVEWPDHEVDTRFPSIVLLSDGEAEYAAIGLTSYVEEETKDVYGPGTVVQWQYEHTENIAVEVWASSKPERRALLAAIETALTPTEQMYGIRFRMPGYFNQLVCFTPMFRRLPEEADAARGRRRAAVVCEMRFNVVALVNYTSLSVVLQTQVDVDEDTGLAVDLEVRVDDPARKALPPLEPCGPSEIFTGKG